MEKSVKVFTRTEGGYGISVSDETGTHSTAVWPGDSDPVSPQFLFHALEQIAQLQAELKQRDQAIADLGSGFYAAKNTIDQLQAERDELRKAAEALRQTQRDYLADRGNDEKGKAVAVAAAALDAALSEGKGND